MGGLARKLTNKLVLLQSSFKAVKGFMQQHSLIEVQVQRESIHCQMQVGHQVPSKCRLCHILMLPQLLNLLATLKITHKVLVNASSTIMFPVLLGLHDEGSLIMCCCFLEDGDDDIARSDGHNHLASEGDAFLLSCFYLFYYHVSAISPATYMMNALLLFAAVF